MSLPSRFISCDWGTSAFRLRLVESSQIRIIAEVSTNQGIANTFELWKQSGKIEEERVNFYLGIVKGQVEAIEKKTQTSLENVPVVVSGMASSNIGLIEIPYKAIPFLTSGSDLETRTIEADHFFKHKCIIVSGVRSEDDVMRGEETKMVGCSQELKSEAFYILPGTHPKHIEVENGKVTSFETYMTGEFFKLLSEKSILSSSVQEAEYGESKGFASSFREGVICAKHLNLLHNAFLVRTNQLFSQYSKQENYFYLSGLLIGSELTGYEKKQLKEITIVSNTKLMPFYELALNTLYPPDQGFSIRSIDADEALIKGQQKILANFFFDKE